MCDALDALPQWTWEAVREERKTLSCPNMAEDSAPRKEQGVTQKKAKCVRCNITKYVDHKKWCKECNDTSNPDIYENCVKCKTKVRNTDNGLQCDNCLGWYHAGCDQVDQDDFKVFKK